MVHTALLIIDMQKAFDSPIWGERNNPQAEHQALRVLAYFRKHDLPVLHVQHISDNPQSQFHNKQNQEFKSGFEPVASEPVFQKTVNSAFIGTNLETYLRKKQICRIVVVGLTLPHCVSTTTRMAANLGFEVTLLADATASFTLSNKNGQTISPETIHEINLLSLQDEFAQILTTEEFLTQVQV